MNFTPQTDRETGVPFCRRVKFCGNVAERYGGRLGHYGQLCVVCAFEKQRKQRAASARRRAQR